jgi:hypothetical protein
MQSEMALWGKLGAKLATTRSATEAFEVVITNFHAFKPRERVELSKGGRQLLQGRTGEELQTLETDGQMIQRVMNDLMGMKDILVINDEAHHCYREKPTEADDEDLKGDDKKEAEKANFKSWKARRMHQWPQTPIVRGQNP